MNKTHSNPFPGLRPFKTKETHLFFGRGNQVIQLVQRLRQTRFLAIVGASGCGKSSLIRAGLLPSLMAKENSPLIRAKSSVETYRDMVDGENVAWRMVTMRPGDSPTKELALALSKKGKVDDHWEEGQRDIYTNIVETTLRSSSMGLVKTVREARLPDETRILILVDQFEELFRFWSHRKESSSGDEAQAFVRLLLNGAREPSVPIYIILTMRSDYLGNCMVFPGLPEAISESQYLVPRMSRNELLKSITGPLAASDEKIAPRLASHLLNDLGEDQDQLPILQHFLMRLWDRWIENRQDNTPLDFQHLQKEDSIQKALGKHADQIYEELAEENKQNIVKKIFKVLTETNSEGLGIRRPVSLQLICDITGESEQDIIAVIERFRAPGCSFLMPPAGTDLFQDTIIDLSHESLMRTWNKLEDWIDEEENSARYYRRYLDAAKGWHEKKNGDKSKVFLWTDINDDRLDFALLWQKKYHPNAAWAALYTPDRDMSLAATNYGLVGSFILQSKQGREKERKRLEKKRIFRIITGLAVGGLVLVLLAFFNYEQKLFQEEKLEQAIIAGVRGVQDPLVQALVLKEKEYKNVSSVEKMLHKLVLKEKEDANASGAENLLRNISTEFIPQAVYLLAEDDGNIAKVAIHPAGTKVAIGTVTGSIYIWDWQSSDSVVETLEANGEGSVAGLAFINNGDGLVSAWSSGSSCYWRLIENRGKCIDLPKTNDRIQSFAINPTNRSFAYGLSATKSVNGKNNIHGKIVPFNITKSSTSFQDLERFGGTLDSPPVSLAFSNNKIVSGARNGSINLLDISPSDGSLRELRKLFTLPERNGPNPYLSITHDDNGLLAIGIEDGLMYLLAPEDNSNYPCISKDTYDQCPFDVDGYNCIALKPEKNYGNVVGVGFWDNRLYGGYKNGTVSFWQCDESTIPKTYRQNMVLKGHKEEIVDVALASQRDVMISADGKEVRVWDLKQIKKNQIATLNTRVNGLAISQKGDIFFAGADGRIISWNIDQHGKKRQIGTVESALNCVDVSRDGTKVVTGAEDGFVMVWDVKLIDAPLKSKQMGNEVSAVIYSSKKGRVYFGTGDRLMIWSPEGDPVLFHQLEDEAEVVTLALNEDETMLVAGFENGVVKAWRKLNEKDPVTLGRHEEYAVRSISFLDNNQVVSAGDDGRVCLWDITSENQPCGEIVYFRGAAAQSVDAGISVGGNKMVAGGGADGSILWVPVIKDGQPLTPKVVQAEDFSFKIGQSEGPISNIRFSHDARYIISTGDNGSIQKWPLTMQGLLERLKNITNVSLTDDEREQFLHEPKEDVVDDGELSK